MAKIETVKMIKPNQSPGLPTEADIHPDEVENMKKTGWVVVGPEQKKAKESDKS